MKKICQRKLPKLSSRSNQSSTFAMFGDSKMSLQKHSERQHDSNIFPKMRQDFTKKQKSLKIMQTVSPISITLECAKSDTFFKSVNKHMLEM